MALSGASSSSSSPFCCLGAGERGTETKAEVKVKGGQPSPTLSAKLVDPAEDGVVIISQPVSVKKPLCSRVCDPFFNSQCFNAMFPCERTNCNIGLLAGISIITGAPVSAVAGNLAGHACATAGFSYASASAAALFTTCGVYTAVGIAAMSATSNAMVCCKKTTNSDHTQS